MMNFKKAIARRTFIRGAGATLALPLLDAMVPAFASSMDSAAKPAVRMAIVFVPNGRIMDKWTPKVVGTTFDLPPILEPLSAFKDQMLVVSGLCSRPKESKPTSEFGPHATAAGWFLTGLEPKPPAQAATTVDQIAAQELGKHTQYASLELSLESGETGAGGDGADSDAYLNTMSWKTPTTPLPVENNPRRVFERLFGETDTTNPAERKRIMEQDRSILDVVVQQMNSLMTGLGASDRAKLSEYLDGIRDIERRIQMSESQTATDGLHVMDRPAGMPTNYEEHAKLMFDLQVLAFQADLTRVITFAMAKEKSERAYREIGHDEGHHALTHHGGDPRMIAKVVEINIYQSKLFSYFLERLRATKDGDGSLLDHSEILLASSLSDGNGHSQQNLPMALFGSGAGRIKGGRHMRVSEGTSLSNLFLTMLDVARVPIDHFGSSTGELEGLSVL